MFAKKSWMILAVIVLCTFVFGSFQVVAGPISMTTTIPVGEGIIGLSYSSEEDILRINYSSDDKEYQLVLSSTQEMGLLVEVAGAEVAYSLRFLEEEAVWPLADTLEEEEYASRAIFQAPGWMVLVVQKSGQGGEFK